MRAEDWRGNALLERELSGFAGALASDTERVRLPARTRIGGAGDRGHVWFPLDLVACAQVDASGHAFQVGLFGRGDAIGLHALLRPDFPDVSALVLRSGFVCRVRRQPLLDLARENVRLATGLTSYLLGATGRFLEEAAMALHLTLERRVARWIVTCRAALGSDDIHLTHQDIAAALGVRRSGVTVSLHVLEGEGLIRSRRARIEIVDPARLAAFADASRPAARPVGAAPGVARAQAG